MCHIDKSESIYFLSFYKKKAQENGEKSFYLSILLFLEIAKLVDLGCVSSFVDE